jgi:hypothetical protein
MTDIDRRNCKVGSENIWMWCPEWMWCYRRCHSYENTRFAQRLTYGNRWDTIALDRQYCLWT